ncbi:MAG: radical SAM protein [Acidobacteria bacterium]|nr:radical SAM protein [Acidobacteriota bacterium]
MDILRLIPLIGRQKLQFVLNHAAPLPFNITLSVTFRCPSRCLTCNVTSRKVRELTPEEYRKIFHGLGKNAYWVTISGGEPFLRPDLPEIIDAIVEESSPGIINIPTSGTTHAHIFKFLPQILAKTKGSQLTLNFSLDEIGERHDQIRRTPKNWEKTLESLRFAHSLRSDYPHLTVGIHTVISIYNIERLPVIYEELQKLAPDSYITEIAEEREELRTLGTGITPGLDQYSEALNFIMGRIRARRHRGFASVIQQLRLEYYELVKRTLKEKRQVIPCYAGRASCHIAADGVVWGCCVRAEPLGSLRDVGFDFEEIWENETTRKFRRSVKNGECYCPLANASYTNMIMDSFTMARIGRNRIFSGRGDSQDVVPNIYPKEIAQ